jgi:hypothetical protein
LTPHWSRENHPGERDFDATVLLNLLFGRFGEKVYRF